MDILFLPVRIDALTDAPHIAILLAKSVEAACSAVDDRVSALTGVGAGDAEDGDVFAVLQAGVANGPFQICFEDVVDAAFGVESVRHATADAVAELDEAVEGFDAY